LISQALWPNALAGEQPVAPKIYSDKKRLGDPMSGNAGSSKLIAAAMATQSRTEWLSLANSASPTPLPESAPNSRFPLMASTTSV